MTADSTVKEKTLLLPVELLHVAPAVACKAAVVAAQHLRLQALVNHLAAAQAAAGAAGQWYNTGSLQDTLALQETPCR
jgi:hypothetical protein